MTLNCWHLYIFRGVITLQKQEGFVFTLNCSLKVLISFIKQLMGYCSLLKQKYFARSAYRPSISPSIFSAILYWELASLLNDSMNSLNLQVKYDQKHHELLIQWNKNVQLFYAKWVVEITPNNNLFLPIVFVSRNSTNFN